MNTSLSGTSAPATALVGVGAFLEELGRAGWEIIDGLHAVQVRGTPSNDHRTLLDHLKKLEPVSLSSRLVSRVGPGVIQLNVRAGELDVGEVPTADPDSLFDSREEQALAARVWDGEAEAALRLGLEWSVECELDLTRLLPPVDGARILAFLRTQTLLDRCMALPFWDLADVVGDPSDAVRRIFVALDAPPERLDLGGFSLAGPATLSAGELPSVTVPDMRSPVHPTMPNARALLSEVPPSGNAQAATHWQSLVDYFRSCGCAIALCELASDVKVGVGEVVAEFRGYRRITVTLPPEARVPPDVLQLHSWVFADVSPDRLLAVQQVASLQDPEQLLSSLADLRDSATIVYTGLRSNAVAEAVKGYRDAHSAALEAARQVVKATQELTKSATERGLASLVAVGAVLMARASADLESSLATNLLFAVMVALIVLALVSVLLEGPNTGAALRHLQSDLKMGSPMLSPSELTKIVELESVKSANRRQFAARWAIPLLYVAGVAAIGAIAIPQVR